MIEMQMFRKLILQLAVLLAISVFPRDLWAGDQEIALLKGQIADLEGKLSELEAEKEELLLQSDELSERIEALKLKEKDRLGIVDDRRLTKALQESQELSERVEALEDQIDSLKKAISEKMESLKERYGMEISSIMAELDTVTGKVREKLLKKLVEYRSAKLELEPEGIGLKAGEVDLGDIKIEEYDGPEEIREKADLIADYVDRMNIYVKAIEARIGDLEQEKSIRRKLQEFAEEISFFDEDLSEGRSLEVKTGAVEARGPMDVESLSPAARGGLTSTSVPSETAYRIYPGELSLDEIDREIERLKKQSLGLSKRSSALLKKAKRFYREAAEIEGGEEVNSEP